MEKELPVEVEEFQKNYDPSNRPGYAYRFIDFIQQARAKANSAEIEIGLYTFLKSRKIEVELLNLLQLILRITDDNDPGCFVKAADEIGPLQAYECLIWALRQDDFLENNPLTLPISYWREKITLLGLISNLAYPNEFQSEKKDLLELSEMYLLRKILQGTSGFFFWARKLEKPAWFDSHPQARQSRGTPFLSAQAEEDPLVLRTLHPLLQSELKKSLQLGSHKLIIGPPGSGKTAGAIWLTNGCLNLSKTKSVIKQTQSAYAPFPIFYQERHLPSLLEILTKISLTIYYYLAAYPEDFATTTVPNQLCMLSLFCRCTASVEELLNRLEIAGMLEIGKGGETINYINRNYQKALVGRPVNQNDPDLALPSILLKALPKGYNRLHVILDWTGDAVNEKLIFEAQSLQRDLIANNLDSTFFMTVDPKFSTPVENNQIYNLGDIWKERENRETLYALRCQERRLNSLQFLVHPQEKNSLLIQRWLIHNTSTPHKLIELGSRLIQEADRMKKHRLTRDRILAILPNDPDKSEEDKID